MSFKSNSEDIIITACWLLPFLNCFRIQKEKRVDWVPNANTSYSVSVVSPTHLSKLFSFISLVMPVFCKNTQSTVPYTPCSRLCLMVYSLHGIPSPSILIWSNPTQHSFIYLNVKAQFNSHLFQEAFPDVLSWSSLPFHWIPIAVTCSILIILTIPYLIYLYVLNIPPIISLNKISKNWIP